MLKVYSIMILTMFLWGINVSLLKLLVNVLPPLMMQGVRILIAGITLFLILIILKKKIIYKEMPWKWVMLACLLNVILHHSFLATGMVETTAVKTSLILGLAPLITAIIAVATRSTTLTKLKLIGFIIGFIGITVAVVDDVSNITSFGIGDFFVFIAILVQAISFFAIRRITQTIPPIVLTAYMLTIGSSCLVLFSFVLDPKSILPFAELDGTMWGVLLFSAVFATAVGHSLYNSMIKKIGAAETAIFTNFSTIFAIVGAVIVLGEDLHSSQIVGCLLIVIGVLTGTGAIEDWISKRRAKKLFETPVE